MIRFELPNLQQRIDELDKFVKKLPGILGKALFQEGERIMGEAKEITPVDLGALRSTGHVTTPDVSRDAAEVELAFGGPAAPYAFIVHERMDPRVRWSVPGTGPKYLEKPVIQNEKLVAEALAQAIDELVEAELGR